MVAVVAAALAAGTVVGLMGFLELELLATVSEEVIDSTLSPRRSSDVAVAVGPHPITQAAMLADVSRCTSKVI